MIFSVSGLLSTYPKVNIQNIKIYTDKIREEGIIEGKLEGELKYKIESKLETVRKMKEFGLSMDIIQKSVGLTEV